MKKINALLLLVITLAGVLALAHGEDKAGPHGGFIRMPGGFHTELILEEKNLLKVYLLDMQWQNPTVEKSALSVNYNDVSTAKCSAQIDFYQCTFPKSVDLTKKGKLKVVAARQQQKGIEVFYPLPLKLEVIDDGHGGKH